MLPIKHLSTFESHSLLRNIFSSLDGVSQIVDFNTVLWTINGVALFTDFTLLQLVLGNRMEIDHLTIAFNYTCHVLLLISKYLCIPLSNSLRFSGTYFLIYDGCLSDQCSPISHNLTSFSLRYDGANCDDFFQAIVHLKTAVSALFTVFLTRRRYPVRSTHHILETLFMILNHDVYFT
uniref:Uncharacterized protein n=1 Tax=Lygus hesperus TaxID=30085 RepID=A0A146KWL2_LYGHE